MLKALLDKHFSHLFTHSNALHLTMAATNRWAGHGSSAFICTWVFRESSMSHLHWGVWGYSGYDWEWEGADSWTGAGTDSAPFAPGAWEKKCQVRIPGRPRPPCFSLSAVRWERFNCKLQTKKQTKTTKTRSRNRSISFICLCAVARPGNPTVAGRGQSGAWRPRDKPSFAVFVCFPFAAFAFSPSKPPSPVGSPKQVRILPPGERRGPPGPLSCWNCQHLMRVSQHYLFISETC